MRYILILLTVITLPAYASNSEETIDHAKKVEERCLSHNKDAEVYCSCAGQHAFPLAVNNQYKFDLHNIENKIDTIIVKKEQIKKANPNLKKDLISKVCQALEQHNKILSQSDYDPQVSAKQRAELSKKLLMLDMSGKYTSDARELCIHDNKIEALKQEMTRLKQRYAADEIVPTYTQTMELANKECTQ